MLAPDREPVPHLYQMLVGALRALGRTPSPMVVPAFYLKLLAAEGVRPELDLLRQLRRGRAQLVAFDLDQGGMLCRACRSGTPVSPAALDVLRAMLGGRLNDVLAMERLAASAPRCRTWPPTRSSTTSSAACGPSQCSRATARGTPP